MEYLQEEESEEGREVDKYPDPVQIQPGDEQAGAVEIIREVSSESNVYFLEAFGSLDDETEVDWPEEELMSAVTRELGRQKRKKEVASHQRIYWAKNILLKAL